MLLAITFLVLVSSLSFDSILGQTYTVYSITLTEVEFAVDVLIITLKLQASVKL